MRQQALWLWSGLDLGVCVDSIDRHAPGPVHLVLDGSPPGLSFWPPFRSACSVLLFTSAPVV